MIRYVLPTLALLVTTPLAAQTPAGDTAYTTRADITAAVATMAREMKPGQGFAWHPILRGGSAVAALEYWKAPGRPAVHPAQAEYATVVEGGGTLVMGGTLVAPHTTRADLVEGDRIEGGTTRRLAPGDVILIPAGIPHWFGITGGKLVLLGTKLDQPTR